MKDRMALVFANLDNSSMDLLTSARPLGALPFGGRYRLIDFTLSNLVNGGVETVGVAVREKYLSLLDHIGVAREWDLDRRKYGLSFLPPFTADSCTLYDTKLKALIGSKIYISRNSQEYIILCEPDIICNMDIDSALDTHISTGADISYITVRRDSERYFGTYNFAFKVNGEGRVVKSCPVSAEQDFTHISTGVCIMKRSLLLSLIDIGEAGNYTHLDSQVIASLFTSHKVMVIPFEDYISKIHTGRDYFNAGMHMLERDLRRDVFFSNGRIYTKTHFDMPVLYGLDSEVKSSLIADGSSIEGFVENSIIFRRVKSGKGTYIKNCIIMQDSIIEDGAHLEYCITDKNVRITAGATIIGGRENPRLLNKGATYSE